MLAENRDVIDVEPDPEPEAAPLHNPLFFFVRVFLYLTLAFVVLPLPLFAFGRGAGVVGELFGGIFAVSMALSAGISALVAWGVSRRLRRFRRGEYMAHWTYTEEEWQAFAEAEWERWVKESRQGTRTGLLIGGLSGLILGGTYGYAIYHSVLALALCVPVGGLLGGLLGAFFGWLGGCVSRWGAWRAYQRMRAGVGEAYIGADAAYCGGIYWSWTRWKFHLMRMRLTPGSPAILAFTLRVYMGRGGYAEYTYRAPVPHGREEQARWILHRLCGN